MGLARAAILGIGLGLASLVGQECPAVAPIAPNGTVAGALDAASCQLTDRTPYAAYRLDLPARGQIKLELTGNTSDFSLTLRDASGAKLDAGASLLRPIEAGSYTVLVNGSAPGQAGPFTVNTAFTSEPRMLCDSFPNLGPSQTIAGLLAASACLAPDGTPYQAFTLTTDGAGTLTLTAASHDFTPVIAVRSSDGRPLTLPSTGPVNVLLDGDSQYLVVISSADNTNGAYQISDTFRPGDGETCRSRKTLATSDTDQTAIDANSCFVTIPGSGDQSYYNFYNFTLAAPGLVTMSAISGDFNPTIDLLDAAGNLLAFDSGGGGTDANYNVQSALRTSLPAGDYRLRIFSDFASGGNYTLQFAFQSPDPQPCTAAALNPGDQVVTALTPTSCRTSLGLSDLYTLTLPSAGTLDLEIASGMFDSVVAIRDAKDNLIVRDDEVDGLTGAHVTADLPPGVYTVVAAATSGLGAYQLTTKFTAHDVPACTFAQTLDLNGGFIQRLGPRSCIAANGQPVDYYSFSLAVDSLALAVMTSSEVDGFLTLCDAAGNTLRTDDSSYGSDDPLIVQYLPAGTYKLAARAASSTVGGLYEVDLRTVAGPRPPFCTPTATLTPGDTATGVLTYTACQYTDNTFADFYQLNLAADATIDLRLNSSEFDAYLVLLDSKGALVDEDDDSGGNTNARITRPLAAGAYFLVVKPFGDYTSHGAYTLITSIPN